MNQCPFCLHNESGELPNSHCKGCNGELKKLPCPSAHCNNELSTFTVLNEKFGCWHCLNVFPSRFQYENYNQICYARIHCTGKVSVEMCPFASNILTKSFCFLTNRERSCKSCKGEVVELPCPTETCENTVSHFTLLDGKYGCWRCRKIYESRNEYENSSRSFQSQANENSQQFLINRSQPQPVFTEINYEALMQEINSLKNEAKAARKLNKPNQKLERKKLENINSEGLTKAFYRHFKISPLPTYFSFEVKLPEELGLQKGCVIDLETTSFSPLEGHIVTMGILEKNEATVFQLTIPNYMDFRTFCLRRARETSKPRYSYNARFESEFLELENDWIDLMQYGDLDQSSACLRGLQIAEGKETGIKQAGNFIYQVHSQNSNQWYTVDLSGPEWAWTCDCPSYESGFGKCKHIWAALFASCATNIQAVKARLFSKYRKRLGQCTSAVFEEPAIRGRDVPQIWEQWLKTNKPEFLANITLHCLSDLLRERQLCEE